MLFAPVATYRRPTLHAFERFLSDVMRPPTPASTPTSQTEQAYELSLDLPGVSREHLKVDIEGQVVRIETLPEARVNTVAFMRCRKRSIHKPAAPNWNTACSACIWPKFNRSPKPAA